MSQAKFHIKRDGNPGRCTASVRPCPFGGEEAHYNSLADAQVASARVLEDKFGILADPENLNAGLNIIAYNSFERTMADPKTFAAHVRTFIGEAVSQAGFDNECYCAASYAESIGAGRVLAFGQDAYGNQRIVSYRDDCTDREELTAMVNEKLKAYYNSQGANVKGDNICRAIYFNEDRSVIVAQTGGSNVLDGAVITADGVELVEIKSTAGTGAQIPDATFAHTDADGQLSAEEIHNMDVSSSIKTALAEYNISQSRGTNYALANISDEDAMEHFVKIYQDKGATKLIYTNQYGYATAFDITGDTAKCARELLDDGMLCTLKMRANRDPRPTTMEDKQRFRNIMGSDMNREKDTFQLRDLDHDQVKPGPGGRARYNEYILPISMQEYQRLPRTAEIKVNELSVFPVKLTGELNHRYRRN